VWGFILALGIDRLPLTLWLSFSKYKRVSTEMEPYKATLKIYVWDELNPQKWSRAVFYNKTINDTIKEEKVIDKRKVWFDAGTLIKVSLKQVQDPRQPSLTMRVLKVTMRFEDGSVAEYSNIDENKEIEGIK
jgi:hypothetical protein